MRAALVGFEREHIVRAGLVDLRGDGALRADGINGHGGASAPEGSVGERIVTWQMRMGLVPLTASSLTMVISTAQSSAPVHFKISTGSLLVHA
jgi:hypothetical protein